MTLRNQALAVVIGTLSSRVEAMTGQVWNRDRFTFEALNAALQIVLAGLAPQSELKVPKDVEEQIRYVPEFADFRRPEGIGTPTAVGLLSDLRRGTAMPLNYSAKGLMPR